MLENNLFFDTLFKLLIDNKIENVFCSNLLSNLFNFHRLKITLFEDARSMVYAACGMCATTKSPVLVISNGDNESRSLFSGLTEAYYRNLPIIVVVISHNLKLNYDIGIKDCVSKQCSFSSNTSKNLLFKRLDDCMKNVLKQKMPIFINYVLENDDERQLKNQCLSKTYDELVFQISKKIDNNYYLFIANDIISKNIKLNHPFYSNNGAFSNDGIISTVLGASLSNLHKKYYCILSYKDFIHDINVLGNRHFSKNIIIYILSDSAHKTISDYCESLHINYFFADDFKSISDIFNDSNKSLVIELKTN